MTAHACHAFACKAATKPSLFMCPRHWRMVPQEMKDALWAAYRPGQEIDKRTTREYRSAALTAQRAVRALEIGGPDA
jgi:hypothetical protein